MRLSTMIFALYLFPPNTATTCAILKKGGAFYGCSGNAKTIDQRGTIMERKLLERELVSRLDKALKKEQIYVCYQPQVNYSNDRIVGAEALVRWQDPDCGFQKPDDFIPVLEKNGLISKVDLFVFEEVCKFQRRCIDEGIHAVPISVNMSRFDINESLSYIDSLEEIRRKYDIPVYNLRIEITENFAIDGIKTVSSVLDKLHKVGYVVEMDDFGTGYSSLNILKDLNVDVIKLDMRFLSDDAGVRGGKIISSLIQMAKWLNTPVIAEGVETAEQADYMQSIGCNYIQGYLYMEPSKEDEFFQKLKSAEHGSLSFNYKSFGEVGDNSFWNPKSAETLLFNRFVGPAGIFIYQGGNINMLKVNRKYITELGMHIDESTILNMDFWFPFLPGEEEKYEKTLKDIIKSYQEEECETWRSLDSRCCGEDKVCIRSNIQLIGTLSDQYLFFATIRNITAEKEAIQKLNDNLKKFEMASDQNNSFSWEYDIATSEMRPCSRCRRVLGLPAILKDYPEPVIESGLFPADYADMYRGWHEQLKKGAKSLEAIIPLTNDRIPFHVRYTAEYDENGRPYKAYGSATQVAG